jgi:hypothetical protein
VRQSAVCIADGDEVAGGRGCRTRADARDVAGVCTCARASACAEQWRGVSSPGLA